MLSPLYPHSSLSMDTTCCRQYLLQKYCSSSDPPKSTCNFARRHDPHCFLREPTTRILQTDRKLPGNRFVTLFGRGRLARLVNGRGKSDRLPVSKMKLEIEGIHCSSDAKKCRRGYPGQSIERSFALLICDDGGCAVYSSFRANCGWREHMLAPLESNGYTADVDRSVNGKEYGAIRERDIPVEPLQENILDSMATSSTETSEADQFTTLKLKLEKEGIHFSSIVPGQYSRMLCPKCGGGQGKQRSFSLFIREDLELAMWLCFRDQCGWRGHLREARVCSRNDTAMTHTVKVSGLRGNTKKLIKLETLSEELIAYFSTRMISVETLQRNDVMQRRYKDQIFIAFPYKQNGRLVSCKYRSIDKKFWQEKGTDRIFYGIDDIKGANDIIIVEGEIDKLSLEEAGYCNCISVPNGAPQKVSKKMLPGDTKRHYLYNCKEYLEQASRIILASDADPPGQALAEELAYTLGIERCWRVRWPKRNVVDVYKDANEVLVHLGSAALKEVIENAEPWVII